MCSITHALCFACVSCYNYKYFDAYGAFLPLLAVSCQGEIDASDPHHGPGAVGASALQKALARIQGDKAEKIMSKYTAPEEVIELPGHCMACSAHAVTRVFQTSIPYFKVCHVLC